MTNNSLLGCLVLISSVSLLTMPPHMQPLDSVVSVNAEVQGEVLLLHLQKTKKGCLAFGFGEEMKKADIFVLEIQNSQLILKNARLAGYFPPIYDTSTFTLKEYNLNADSTWEAKVECKVPNYFKSSAKEIQRKIIFNYSLTDALEIGHKGFTNKRGIKDLIIVNLNGEKKGNIKMSRCWERLQYFAKLILEFLITYLS